MKKFLEKENKKRRLPLVFVFVIAFFFGGAGIFLFLDQHTSPVYAQHVSLQNTATKHFNTADLHIAQYSDKHITQNAIISDPHLNTLALADFIKEDSQSAQILSPISQVAGADLAQIDQTSEKEYGTWVWTPTLEMTPAYMNTIISGAKSAGINTIYVSIDSYLDIYAMSDGPTKEAQKKLFTNTLEHFVKLAHEDDIAVDAEAGWRDWAEDGNTYKAFAVINFAKEFNRTQVYTLRGFQYDVEPYLLASYQTEPVPVLENFLALIDESITLLGPKDTSRDLQLSVVIPDFFDNDQSTVAPFAFNGQTSSTYNHLLDTLERRPGSDVIIMAYRNFAEGNDGSIDISNNEVQTATNGMYSTKIIIAQETGDVMPPYITFNNTSKKYYSEELQKLIQAFTPYANFGGVAVHYVNAFLTLK
jgi:hypothetical protein